MTEIPHYRDQPATLDPNVAIPDDAPLAQGHTEEAAADVSDAAAAHAQAVKAEPAEEVGARAAGDHAVAKKPKKE